MPEHELEKLLGGFAADTLTAEERKLLYAAALQDQQLFNALADEQALKELLADPAVRRRLLQALNRARPSTAGGSQSWLEWFRRPATLAYAGGLAVAVLAVLLGTKVYQDSLRQAARIAATEDTKQPAPSVQAPAASQPAAPQIAEPAPKAKQDVEPERPAPKKEPPVDHAAKREKSVAVAPQQQPAPDADRVAAVPPSEQDETRRQADAPVAAQSNTAEQAAAPPLSPRALFYGEPARSDADVMTQDQAPAMKPPSESPQQLGRLEQKRDQLASAGKTASARSKSLGLRYSFTVREGDGRERRIDALITAHQYTQVGLLVEANQDSYIQVWKAEESSTPQLLFPAKESGQISSKLSAGQRQMIPIGKAVVTITIRLSRVPFGPITRQEALMLDRPPAGQIVEPVPQEHATYVVSQDLSPTAQLSVEIPMSPD